MFAKNNLNALEKTETHKPSAPRSSLYQIAAYW